MIHESGELWQHGADEVLVHEFQNSYHRPADHSWWAAWTEGDTEHELGDELLVLCRNRGSNDVAVSQQSSMEVRQALWLRTLPCNAGHVRAGHDQRTMFVMVPQ